MLGAIQQNMPAERFAALMELLEQNMAEKDFSSLKLQLAMPAN
jgi:hypothetical protein